MIENDVRLSAADPRWWTAPLVTTLLGLPLILWGHAMWGTGTVGVLGGAVYWAVLLLATAWALPHRRSARMLRVTLAVAGLVCAVLPLLLVVLMAWAMASG
ncbi:hypothetical protein [Streptomyces sp. SD31]|uniref:hypothetical protein n=1 Tax=Streptomyces sp. SD31 TaxID=3452208 RepID=UPI003F8ADDA7